MIPTEVAKRHESPPDAKDAPLCCRVFRGFKELEHFRGEWDETVAQNGGSVYMTYDWTRVWWEHYGESAELRLFLFFAADRIIAIVPLYIDTLGWGPLSLRVARLVGANVPPKVFSAPIPAWCGTEVFERVLTALFSDDACDLFSFGPFSEQESWKEALSATCAKQRHLVAHCTVKIGVHSVFHLPADMESYFASLSKNERKNRRKYELRLLNKDYETRVDVVSETPLVSEEFDRFTEQHRKQWATEGKTGHFGAWPRAFAFNRALVEAQAKLRRVRFIRIIANEQVIASQYVFAFADRYFWELPARAVESSWERFSLGPTGIVTMLAQAIAEGMTRVEGGLAHYDYKVRLGAKEYTTLTLRMVARRRMARARVLLFSFARDCMSVAYHKMWYRRIMPRLPPRFWRHQSRMWLRLDF